MSLQPEPVKTRARPHMLRCVQCQRLRSSSWKFDAAQRLEPAPLCITCVARSATRCCPACNLHLPSSAFSRTQMRKYASLARCAACVAARRFPEQQAPVPAQSRYLYKITTTWSADDDTIH